ncbi:MAG TPA: hypothetical protein VF950_06395 [Planctomycetota bacterium]
MPQRINGIGTSYVGKSNVLSRTGECEACKRGAVLTSYDTRLWFTFVFIPVVPLAKKRILDYCSSCTTHRAVPLAEWEGIKRKGMEEAARKALAEPANADAQIDLHRTCLVMGEWDKADAFQKKLEAEFAKDAKVQLYLAGAHAYRGRAAEAEAALARARAIDPAIAPPEAPENPVKPVKARASRGQAIAVGAIIAIVLLGAAGTSYFKAGARTLYVVSGLDQPVTVEISGQPAVTVPSGAKLPFQIPEGKHRARVSGAIQEDIDFVLESNFFARLFDDRVFVLNPGAAGLLVVEETHYGKNVNVNAIPPYKFLYGKTFYAIDDIDYPFAPAPASITTKESGVIKKRQIDLQNGAIVGIVYGLLNNKRPAEALDVAEWAIRARPAERDAVLPVYVGMARSQNKLERALALLRERAAKRPVEIEAHRQYQRLRGTSKELIAEYDQALAKTPKDADLLYLRGRLEGGISGARNWYERALQADPKQCYAHYALGYGHGAEGDWGRAKAALTKAVEGRPASAEFKTALRHARLGAGDLETAEKEIREEVKRAPVMLWATQELARVLVARGKTAEAKALVEPYRDVLRRAKEPNSAELIRNLEVEILYAAGEFEALLNLKGGNPKEPSYDHAIALMELGKVDEALKAGDEDDVHLLLAAVLARPEDAALREKAAAALEEEDSDAAPLAAALRTGSEAELAAAMDVAMDTSLKAAALAAIARRIPSRAGPLRELAGKLNTQLTFPYHAVKRALAAK